MVITADVSTTGIGNPDYTMSETPTLRDNDNKFLEKIFQEVKKLDPKALFDIVYYPSSIRVKIQLNESYRGQIFNKLHHLHNLYGLRFKPTSFIKKDKNLITFDLEGSRA